VFLPHSRVLGFLAWHTRELGHFPLWCVPYARVQDYAWLADGFYRELPDQLFVDFAIYGMKQPADGRNYHRLIEEKLFALGGLKTLLRGGRVLADLEQAQLRAGQGPRRPEQRVPRPLRQDLPGGPGRSRGQMSRRCEPAARAAGSQ
jgi:hypothetical protein